MNEVLLEENLSLKKVISDISLENQNLKNQVEKLQRFLVTMKREKFGRKSERVIDDGTSHRSLLDLLNDEDKGFFNEAEVIDNATSSEKEEIEISYKRQKAKRVALHELPVDEVQVVDLPESEKQCPDHNVPLQKVGEHVVLKLQRLRYQSIN